MGFIFRFKQCKMILNLFTYMEHYETLSLNGGGLKGFCRVSSVVLPLLLFYVLQKEVE
jgi:hypothetical protein